MTDTASSLPPGAAEATLTAQIVSAYLGHNHMPAADVPRFVADVHAALTGIANPAPVEAAATEAPVPAIPLRNAVTPDSIGCLCCGQRFKSIKRHLMVSHQLTPEAYRELWGLKPDHPMVAASYSATRSAFAKANGLGRQHVN